MDTKSDSNCENERNVLKNFARNGTYGSYLFSFSLLFVCDVFCSVNFSQFSFVLSLFLLLKRPGCESTSDTCHLISSTRNPLVVCCFWIAFGCRLSICRQSFNVIVFGAGNNYCCCYIHTSVVQNPYQFVFCFTLSTLLTFFTPKKNLFIGLVAIN